MTAANDNYRTLSPAERYVVIESILEEFDLLCLGTPTPDRISCELRSRGFI